MRLVCPNCGAQYEVDDRVIPDSGRDVQCSACGHAWYQMPLGYPEADDGAALPDHDDTLLPEDEGEAEGLAAEAQGEDESAAPDEFTPEERAADDAEPEVAARAGEGSDEVTEPEAAGRPTMGEEVRSILREEAEHELSRRAAEQVETQPDLGLDSSPSPEEERRRIARERMARMRGLDEDEAIEEDVAEPETPPEAEPEDARARPPRRELFPDIEEINSTLDGRGMDRDADVTFVEGARSGGFARGFFLVIFLAALLLAVYMLAPNLSETIPAIEPALVAYVEAVNAGRAWLDTTMQGLIAQIEALVGDA
jgi:predicted Zn finger-like uncharacterized protein